MHFSLSPAAKEEGIPLPPNLDESLAESSSTRRVHLDCVIYQPGKYVDWSDLQSSDILLMYEVKIYSFESQLKVLIPKKLPSHRCSN